MQTYFSRILNKLIIYLLVHAIGGLLLPALILSVFFEILPKETNRFGAEYLSQDGRLFRLQGFKENKKIKYIILAESDKDKEVLDEIFFIDQKDRRIGLFAVNDATEYTGLIHAFIKKEKFGRDIQVTGGYTAGYKHKSKFSDGTYCVTQPEINWVLQMISPNNLKESPIDILSVMGIIHERADIPTVLIWLKKHEIPFVIFTVFAYGLFWALVILRSGAEWAATVEPAHGVVSQTKETLRKRVLELNKLELPFKIEATGTDTLKAVWKYEGKWEGLFESEALQTTHEIRMRFREGSNTVTAMEVRRSISEAKGFLRLSKNISYSRSITFWQYETNHKYGLSFNSGRPELTGEGFTFDIQEIKNPLIEIIIASGWAWKPKIFCL